LMKKWMRVQGYAVGHRDLRCLSSQCDNRTMRKPLIVLRTFLAVGVVLLGNALAQTTAPKTPTPPAKKSATPATKTTPSTATKSGTAQSVTALTTDKQKTSYAIGMNIGAGLHRQGIELDDAVLLQGMKDVLSGGKTLMTEDEARAALTKLQAEMQAKQQE